MPTPHNSAPEGAFAKTVLMPGDPLRAQFIARTFLTDAQLVNNVRGVQGYTGTYKGTPVSVMASGMGMPAIGIYSHELFHFYDVDNIIRVGSAGAISPKLKLRDLVLAQGACTDSSYAHQFGLSGMLAPIADFTLLETAVGAARAAQASFVVGNIFSSDVFYNQSADTLDWGRYGGERGPVLERRSGRETGADYLHDFRFPCDRRGVAPAGKGDLFYADDGNCTGNRRENGCEISKINYTYNSYT